MLSDGVFDDLFQDEYNFENSASSTNLSNSEDDGSDSGHGSPGGSGNLLTSSPTSPIQISLPWESSIKDSEWGSILDDLPDELLESDIIDQPTEYFPLATTEGDDPVSVCSKDNDLFNNILNVSALPLNTSQSTVNALKPLQMPLVLKQVNSTMVQNGNIKSHIKIGKNVFAIISNSNLNSAPVTPLKTVMNQKKSDVVQRIKIEDHDYYEDTEFMKTTGVSQGIGPGLVLTDEEKSLLEMENTVIPEDCGLTKDEEKILKKVRRKIKNKQSAMESRRRRKEYIDNLEHRVKSCTDMNLGLKKKVDNLTEDNRSLLKQLKDLQSIVATSVQQNRKTQKGTCFAMLVLSFAFFFLPFNPMFGYKTDGGNDLPTVSPTATFRSRTLLHVDDSRDYEYLDTNASHHTKLFPSHVRAEIEHLLLTENGAALKDKMAGYLRHENEQFTYVEFDEEDTIIRRSLPGRRS